MLWNLDLNDRMIPDFVKRGFSPAERLPFYTCWTCVAASYRISGQKGISTFDFDAHTPFLKANESPLRDSPTELPRRRISFVRIPSEVDAVLALFSTIGLDAIDKAGRSLIDEYYGREIDSESDLPFSQFGGQLFLYQGARNLVCPNPKCPANRLTHPYGELEIDYLMKELAVLHVDAEPELKKCYFQLVYYICCVCFSIRAEYQCT